MRKIADHSNKSIDCTVRDSASELLQSLRADIRTTEERIQNDLNRMVRDVAASGDLQDDFFTMRNGRYVLPVKTSNRGRVPGIIHDSSNTEETVFIEPFAILDHELGEVHRLILVRGPPGIEHARPRDEVSDRLPFGRRHPCLSASMQ